MCLLPSPVASIHKVLEVQHEQLSLRRTWASCEFLKGRKYRAVKVLKDRELCRRAVLDLECPQETLRNSPEHHHPVPARRTLIWRLLMPQGCHLKAGQRKSGRSHMFFLSSSHSKIFYSWTGWKHECSEARQAHAPSWHLGRGQGWIWSSWFFVLWNQFASFHECKSCGLVYKPCSSLSGCDSVFSIPCLHLELLLRLGLISMIITTVLSFSLCSFYIWYHLRLYDTKT